MRGSSRIAIRFDRLVVFGASLPETTVVGRLRFLDDFGVAFSESASDADELGEVLFLLTDVCLGFGADVLVPRDTTPVGLAIAFSAIWAQATWLEPDRPGCSQGFCQTGDN